MAYAKEEQEQDAILDKIIRNCQGQQRVLTASSALAADTPVRKSKWAKIQEAYLTGNAHGFEEFFADVPIRPEEYLDEQEQYSVQKTPATRFELCIQKYRRARKLVNEGWRERVFNAYLIHGGIKTGQKDYLGSDNNDATTAEEIKTTKAVDFVDETDDREVDFVFVIKSFFSYRCTAAAGHLFECVKQAPEVIINFLRYVNLHNVLPEYRSQINEAIAFAEEAKKEIYQIKLLSLQLPGKFNQALSTVYGGYFNSLVNCSSDWNTGNDANISFLMSISSARDYIFKVLPEFPQSIAERSICLKGLPVEVQSISRHNADLSSIILLPWLDNLESCSFGHVATKTSDMCILMENSIADKMYERLHLEADFYCLGVKLVGHDMPLYYFDSATRVLPTYYVETDEEHL